MTFILTNDDGIDAPGLNALKKAINGNVITVAPQNHLSGCGHQLTTHKPINVEKRTETAYAIDGTPADCSRIAIKEICKETKWVLSGINAGGNLGVDVYISGTVAAVREAAILGIPGIAFSHWIKRPLVVDWDLATQWTEKILANLFSLELPSGCFWNVNLPHISPDSKEPEIVFCKPSIDPLPTNFKIEGNSYFYQGEYAKRKRTPNTDVDVCFSGNIAVTMLKV